MGDQQAPNSPQRNRRGKEAAAPLDIRIVDRRLSRSWLLLSVTAVVTPIGLTATILFLPSLWTGPDFALLMAVPLLVAILVVHLTRQRRQLAAERTRAEQLQNQALEKRYCRTFELLNVGHILDSEANPRAVFDGITKMCLEVFDCEKVSLMLPDSEDQYLEVQSATGYSTKNVVGAQQRIGEGISGWAAQNRKPILLTDKSDLKAYPGLSFKSRAIPAAMVVPIIIRDKLIGVLNISTRSKKIDYDEKDLKALQAFAETVGTYIVHLDKARRMKQTIQEQQRALHEKYMATSP